MAARSKRKSAKAETVANGAQEAETEVRTPETPIAKMAGNVPTAIENFDCDKAIREFTATVKVSVNQSVTLISASVVAMVANEMARMAGSKTAEKRDDFAKRLKSIIHEASSVESNSQLSEYVSVAVTVLNELVLGKYRNSILPLICKAESAEMAVIEMANWFKANGMPSLEAIKRNCGKYTVKADAAKKKRAERSAASVAANAIKAVEKQLENGSDPVAAGAVIVAQAPDNVATGIAQGMAKHSQAVELFKAGITQLGSKALHVLSDAIEKRLQYYAKHPKADPDTAPAPSAKPAETGATAVH